MNGRLMRMNELTVVVVVVSYLYTHCYLHTVCSDRSFTHHEVKRKQCEYLLQFVGTILLLPETMDYENEKVLKLVFPDKYEGNICIKQLYRADL